ncbi:MAG: tetratricopeptide repeat protein [Chitinophagales bacterium]
MKKLFFYFTILFIALPSNNTQGQSDDTDVVSQKFYDKAVKAYEKEDYEKALDWFMKSIEEGEAFTEEAYNYLGKSYYANRKEVSGVLEEEVVDVKSSMETDVAPKESIQLNTSIGADLNTVIKNYITSEETDENPTEELPPSMDTDTASVANDRSLGIATSAYQGGVAAYRKSDYVGAIQYFNIVIDAGEGNTEKALNYRGMCYHALGDYTAAITDYDSTLTLEPDSYITYHNRGIAHQSAKLYNKALMDYNKTIQINPSYSRAYESRAVLYYKMRDMQKAQSDCEKILEMNPDSQTAKRLQERLEQENK